VPVTEAATIPQRHRQSIALAGLIGAAMAGAARSIVARHRETAKRSWRSRPVRMASIASLPSGARNDTDA